MYEKKTIGWRDQWFKAKQESGRLTGLENTPNNRKADSVESYSGRLVERLDRGLATGERCRKEKKMTR